VSVDEAVGAAQSAFELFLDCLASPEPDPHLLSTVARSVVCVCVCVCVFVRARACVCVYYIWHDVGIECVWNVEYGWLARCNTNHPSHNTRTHSACEI